jgi:hypothetical protein
MILAASWANSVPAQSAADKINNANLFILQTPIKGGGIAAGVNRTLTLSC